MGFKKEISEAAEMIKNARSATIISHIDADGITSEAIMRQAVSRYAIDVNSVFVRQLEPMTMKYVPDNDSLKIFIDLGAGQQNLLEERGLSEDEVLIIDHHVSQDVNTPSCRLTGLNTDTKNYLLPEQAISSQRRWTTTTLTWQNLQSSGMSAI